MPRARSKTGVVAGSYEYRRYENGQAPFWTPLRFPGQYYDAESDLFENWNRYYDPNTGRYLQAEPLLARSASMNLAARVGTTPPIYPYALNNPLNLQDPAGEAAVTNHTPFPIPGSGNPGRGRGSGAHRCY